MKPFELFLYVGSTLSLWFGISVYGLSVYFKRYFKASDRGLAGKQSLLKRARRILTKRPSKVRSGQTSNKTTYSTLNLLEGPKFKEKLSVNYRQTDLNYMQNIGQFAYASHLNRF